MLTNRGKIPAESGSLNVFRIKVSYVLFSLISISSPESYWKDSSLPPLEYKSTCFEVHAIIWYSGKY